MQAYRKWILSLGIAAVTPGIALAGPFSFFKSDQEAACDATLLATGETQTRDCTRPHLRK